MSLLADLSNLYLESDRSIWRMSDTFVLRDLDIFLEACHSLPDKVYRRLGLAWPCLGLGVTLSVRHGQACGYSAVTELSTGERAVSVPSSDSDS
jgi:hypothetical protein